MDEPVLKGRGILLGKASDTSPEPSLFDLGGLEIETTDSTTVKTIAEPYLLASVNFYRIAIIINPPKEPPLWRSFWWIDTVIVADNRRLDYANNSPK